VLLGIKCVYIDRHHIAGSELEQGFIDLGYELFKDNPEKLKSKFFAADFFSPESLPGLEEHSYDMIHAASFFHLFNWDEQVEAWGRALKMLEPKVCSLQCLGNPSEAYAKTLSSL